ncbi:MAG: CatB-related O-acetyltransferase [Sphingobacteriales bacterium]
MKAWIKRNYYRFNTKKPLILGENVLLNMKCRFEGLNTIQENCEISSCEIGMATYICAGSVVRSTRIGRFCSIGRNLQTGLGMHPTEVFVSTHPSFFSTAKPAGFTFVEESLFKENKYADADGKFVVDIGNDVWIGNNVTVLDGIKIGDGAIIATGSVVTKDVDPYAIVAGVPAKFKKYRFSANQIDKLLTVKWWNWDIEDIKAQKQLFTDITSFIANT